MNLLHFTIDYPFRVSYNNTCFLIGYLHALLNQGHYKGGNSMAKKLLVLFLIVLLLLSIIASPILSVDPEKVSAKGMKVCFLIVDTEIGRSVYRTLSQQHSQVCPPRD